MAIKLKTEVEEQLIGSLRRYWKQEEGEDLGELRARLFLKFIVQEIGPGIYNQAIQDAQEYMQEKAAEMEISCYAEEFTYWSSRKKSPRA
ncbi:MAG: DUF2164 domain-containing protein [Pollutimonas bauzanensis]|uniref:Uncharacterized conserved protein, DUF2164 family n=1 Tax=Pollutimonas bauzanensis TaxID=658167 RepID=A0A1M5ZT42_9BURK|nr:DUF2164 domain-containing protein [Pollutimonas bauzanensis]SHI27384.1 Uncharacterized conserved protein, DUF2164 family [Pollutimonas bauzanensis]